MRRQALFHLVVILSLPLAIGCGYFDDDKSKDKKVEQDNAEPQIATIESWHGTGTMIRDEDGKCATFEIRGDQGGIWEDQGKIEALKQKGFRRTTDRDQCSAYTE
jgi:hypothetical protein